MPGTLVSHADLLSGWPSFAHTADAACAALVSHSRTVPSALPAATTWPEGENATEYTCPFGPVMVATRDGCAGTARFHSQTVPSVTPAARVLPSGLKATE